MSHITTEPTWRESQHRELDSRHGFLVRAWERIQYPGGPATRARIEAAHAARQHGW